QQRRRRRRSRDPLSGFDASLRWRCCARLLLLLPSLHLWLSRDVGETGTSTGAGVGGLVLHPGSERCGDSLDTGGRISGIVNIGGRPRRTCFSQLD
ncbi:hypothetical protein KXX50_009174, partial [Aspergillus fumigatus]